MTLFVSIFSILMVILANHPTNSGAVPKSNLQEKVLTEVRLQRSVAESHKRGRKLGKKHERSGKKQKKSAKKQERKFKRKGHKATKKDLTKPAKRISRKFDPNFEFKACDYLDLAEVGYRQNSDSSCSPGDKFIFKAVKGLRRQFLVTPETNIIVLLERGKKIGTCNDVFRDVTEKVKCKPVPGVMNIKTITKKVKSDCRPGSPPAPASTTAAAPAPVMGSSTKVICRCPEERFLNCFTTVQSTGNMHTVICNNMTSTTIACGSDLYGRDMGVLGVPLTKYNHALCTLRAYLAVQTDLEWSCKDPSVPVPASGSCSDATTAAPTTAAGTTAGATTAGATTAGATTVGPTTTAAATTAAATTAATTAAATTAAATTAAATTAAATTAAATTAAATTAAATTAAATTAAATTAAATTAAATTAAATTAAATEP